MSYESKTVIRTIDGPTISGLPDTIRVAPNQKATITPTIFPKSAGNCVWTATHGLKLLTPYNNNLIFDAGSTQQSEVTLTYSYCGKTATKKVIVLGEKVVVRTDEYYLALGASIEISATGNPPGGDYQWVLNDNKISAVTALSKQVLTI